MLSTAAVRLRSLALIPALTLVAASCATTYETYELAVTQYNGDSVTLQVDGRANYLTKADKRALKIKMQAKATEICRRGHRKQAEYTSTTYRSISQYRGVIERLYLCLR